MEIDPEQNIQPSSQQTNFLNKDINHNNNKNNDTSIVFLKRKWMDAIPNDQEKEEYERAAFEYQMAQEQADEIFEETDDDDENYQISEQLDFNNNNDINNCGPIDWTPFLQEQNRLKKEAFKNRKKFHVKIK